MIAHDSDGNSERRLIDAARLDALGGSSRIEFGHGTPETKLPADALPGYRILGEIHRGGQGVVYRARQETTKRDVAIKVMRDGPFAGSKGTARFEREIRILARLSHPNIVTVHDSSSVDGFHYFVMNHVAGRDIVSYACENHLDERATMALFGRTCRAVSAAHQLGIIHRDLKPSNILVEDSGKPYILDFGLAKLADESEADWQTMTQTGQFLGTLPWASPEQVNGALGTVDVRSDVYSIGVVLYQALTGEFPYGVAGPTNEVISNIIEKRPTPPCSTSAAISDDVQTIVLKCLEKDPNRRYQSSAALSQDVDRYLSYQPIQARPASTMYQLRLLVARHKLVAAMSATMVVGVLSFGIAMNVFYRNAEDARHAERKLRIEAEDNLARAIEAENNALLAANTSERVSGFLVGLFEVSDPAITPGDDLTAREILRRGAQRVENELSGEPDIQATLKHTIARVYCSLGAYDDARAMYESALKARRALYGNNHPTIVQSLNGLAETLYRKNNLGEASRISHESLTIGREIYPGDHVDVANALDMLGVTLAGLDDLDAEGRYRNALAMRRRLFGDHHPDVAESLNHLALLLADRRKYDECNAMLDEAIDIYKRNFGKQHPEIAHCLSTRAKLMYVAGDKAGAETRLREAIEITQAVYGESHPNISFLNNALAVTLKDLKRFDEAEQCYKRALKMDRQFLGEKHRGVGTILNNLGLLYQMQDRHADAIPFFEQAIDVLKIANGVNPIRLHHARGCLGTCYLRVNDYERARPLLQTAHEELAKLLGPDHAWVSQFSKSLNLLKGATSPS